MLGGEEQRARRRVVVVRAAGWSPELVSAARRLVDVLHVGGVVVVGHDHCLPAISAGDDQDDVALVWSVAVPLPSFHPREVEVGLPAKDVVHDLGLAGHAVPPDGCPVLRVEVVPERIEVAPVVRTNSCRRRRRSAVTSPVAPDSVGAVFLSELTVGEGDDVAPDLLLERARPEATQDERWAGIGVRHHRRAQAGDELRHGLMVRTVLLEPREPRFE